MAETPRAEAGIEMQETNALHTEQPTPTLSEPGLRYLPNTQIPAIVFANKGSGGGMGEKIVAAFEQWLGKDQVCLLPTDPRIMSEYTVKNEDGTEKTKAAPHPELFIKRFAEHDNVRIIVCGGDGTMAWILSALDRMNHLRGTFPIAMMPLGTGNDLARQFHWGGTFNSSYLKESFMKKVANATCVGFDRWRMRFAITDDEDATEEYKDHLPATCTIGTGAMTKGELAEKEGSWITATSITDIGERPSLSAVHVNEVRLSHSQLPDDHEAHDTKFGEAAELAKHVDESGTDKIIDKMEDDEVLRASVVFIDKAEKCMTVDAVWCNYFSIGQKIAAPAYHFHRERNAHPEKFKSALCNKIYQVFGKNTALQQGMLCPDSLGCYCCCATNKAASPWLTEVLTLQVQDYFNSPWREVAIPPGIKDVVVLNLQTMAGGTSTFWGRGGGANAYGWQPASPQDGLIEVLAIPENTYSAFCGNSCKFLCQDQVGYRLAQAHAIRIEVRAATYMQLDGEPWRQPACKLEISHAVNGSGESEKSVVLQGAPNVSCCC